MVRRILKVAAVLAVVIIAVYFLLPGFQNSGEGFSTSIFVGTPDGEVQVYTEDPGNIFTPQTILTVSGTTISYIRWETDYKAVSPDYDQYTVPSGNLEVIAIQPSDTVCDGPLKSLEFTVATVRDVDIWYDLVSVNVTADWILSHVQTNGCPLSGDYTLRYTVSLTVQAIGIGELPTDTDSGIYNTVVTLQMGSITAVETTTSGSG